MRIVFIFFISIVSLQLFAQPAQKQLPAKRTASNIKIDGTIDEAAWKEATPATGFIEFRPNAGTVPREEFRKITVDYTIAFAKVLKQKSPDATFCFLSGQGADQTENSRLMFAKDKGIAENFLLSLHFPQTYIFRPSYIYPVTLRKEPNFLYRFMRVIYPFLNVVYHNGVITSEELSNAMIDIGLNGGDKTVYENKELREQKMRG